MEERPTITYRTGIDGWTCDKCGQFVPADTYHVCGGEPMWYGTMSAFAPNYTTLLERIAVALERIVDKMYEKSKVD